jgi:predicted membrane protein
VSYEEKNLWIYAALALVLPLIYFVSLLGQLPNTAVTEIDYQWPMLKAIGAAIAGGIVGTIVIAITSPKDAGKADQRDKEINRLGEYVGGSILGVGMVGPFLMALAEFHHFWIANAMYLVFVLSALIGTTVKLIVYRRGF